MNKIILGVALMLSLASCQQGQKIAFVDNSKLLDDYQEKKDLEALLKGKIDKYQHKRDSSTSKNLGSCCSSAKV